MGVVSSFVQILVVVSLCTGTHRPGSGDSPWVSRGRQEETP